ncbi:MAG TPA: hypothetical protein VGK25_08755 [Ignavibacteria bacterium]|jgi:hypothetical protein
MGLIKKIDPSKDPDLKDWYSKWKSKADEETKNSIKTHGKKINFSWSFDKKSDNTYDIKINIDETANNDWAEGKLKIIIKTEDDKYTEEKADSKNKKETFEINVRIKPVKVIVYKRFEAKAALYGDYKRVLMKSFNNRCAYCESYITHIDYGDVEHFRPKGNVTDDPEHSGYFWLAYNESNFLLSCAKCNQIGGKLNNFPIEGKRAYFPDDKLEDEKPVLLDPSEDDILEHLDFCPKEFELCKGPVAGKTPRGKRSIDIYNLNRDLLKSMRNQKQADIINALKIKLLQIITSGLNTNIADEISKIVEEQEFQSACIAAANAWRESLKSHL